MEQIRRISENENDRISGINPETGWENHSFVRKNERKTGNNTDGRTVDKP